MQLFYREFGEGEPLIVLHGLLGMSDNFVSFGKEFSENHNFRVIIPDLRNHGRSPHHNLIDYFSLSEDVFELIEALNLKKINVIGHSMGGKTAMFLALNYPELVDKLIVADISPVKYNSSLFDYLLNFMNNLDLSEFANRREVTDFIKLNLKDEKAINVIIKNIFTSDFKRLTWKANIPTILQNIDNILNFEIYNRVFGKKTLFMKAEFSNYIKDEHQDTIIKYFPNSKVIVVPNSSHWLHVDNYKSFYSIISEFIFSNS